MLGETPAGRDLLAGKIPEISTQRSKAGGKNVVSGLLPGMDLSVPTLPPPSRPATAGAPTPPVAQTKTTVDVQVGGSKGGEICSVEKSRRYYRSGGTKRTSNCRSQIFAESKMILPMLSQVLKNQICHARICAVLH